MSYDQVNKSHVANNMKLTYGSQFEELEKAKNMEGEDPCEPGYEMIGTKMKNGREVPNCVPKNVEKGEYTQELEKGQKPKMKAGEQPITLIHNKTKESIQGVWRTMSGSRIFVSSNGKLEISPEHVKEKYSESSGKGGSEGSSGESKKDTKNYELSNSETSLINSAKKDYPNIDSNKVAKLAENIAKLDGKSERKLEHFAEAIQYNVVKDKKELIGNMKEDVIYDIKENGVITTHQIDRAIEVGAIDKGDIEGLEEIKSAFEKLKKVSNSQKALINNYIRILSNKDFELKDMAKFISDVSDVGDKIEDTAGAIQQKSETNPAFSEEKKKSAEAEKKANKNISIDKTDEKLLGKFIEMAKNAKDSSSLLKDIRSIQGVSSKASSHFMKKFGGGGELSPEGATRVFFNAVKNNK